MNKILFSFFILLLVGCSGPKKQSERDLEEEPYFVLEETVEISKGLL